MAVAKLDENNNPVLTGVSSIDLITPINVAVNPATNALITEATVTIDTTGLATSTIQTNGSQKTQIVDAGGEAVTVTGGKLDVNASIDTTGLALESKQLADDHNVKANLQVGGNAVTTSNPVPVMPPLAGYLPIAIDQTGNNNAVDVLTIAAGDNNIGNVDIASALPAGTNAIGKLAANSGVDIGDVDVTSLPKSIQGPGIPNIDSYTHAAISTSANTANQSLVSAPGANKQIWVYGIYYVVGTAAGTVSFQDEDDTAISGVMAHALNSGGGFPSSGNFSMPMWKLATNKALEVDTVTCDIEGWLDYAVVSV